MCVLSQVQLGQRAGRNKDAVWWNTKFTEKKIRTRTLAHFSSSFGFLFKCQLGRKSLSVVSQISYKQSCEFDPEDSSPSSENSGGTEQKLKKRHGQLRCLTWCMYVRMTTVFHFTSKVHVGLHFDGLNVQLNGGFKWHHLKFSNKNHLRNNQAALQHKGKDPSTGEFHKMLPSFVFYLPPVWCCIYFIRPI